MAFIKLQDLSIEFPVYLGSSRSLKNTFINKATGGRVAKESSKIVIIKALNNCNLEILPGDRVGLYGHNGSGKTTMLRLMAGVYQPTSGAMHSQGSISSLLDISMGMDGEATGVENIYMRALLMGVERKKIDGIVEEVKEFSGLGDYLDLPIRTYSSGMNMRLAFTISTAVHADIILMDEWLSVGDEDFRQKCDERLKAKIEQSSIFVVASQDYGLLERNCNRILKIESGVIVSENRICK